MEDRSHGVREEVCCTYRIYSQEISVGLTSPEDKGGVGPKGLPQNCSSGGGPG